MKNLEKEGDNGRGGEDEERGGVERMGLLVEGAWQGGRGRTMRKNDGEDIQENRCGGGDGSTGDCRRSGNEEEGEHKREQEMRGERGAIEGKEVRRGERERLGLSRGR